MNQTTLIMQDRLRELEKKERAHDDYLEALRRLREDSARLELRRNTGAGQMFNAGYRRALLDLSQHIANVASERAVPASERAVPHG